LPGNIRCSQYAGVRFGVLGPLLAIVGGERIPISSLKQRTVLAALLLSANRPVLVAQLAEAVWDGSGPPSAEKLIATYVWQLRKLLTASGGSSPIMTTAGGYLLRVEPDALDLADFDALTQQARTHMEQDDHEQAADLFDAALALWRGAALEDTPLGGIWRALIDGLTERRLAAVELRADAYLRLRRYTDVAAELTTLAAAHPLREGLAERLMLALHGDGRRDDALAVFATIRQALHDELGLEPSQRLQAAQRTVLAGGQVVGAAPTRSSAPRQLPLPVPGFIGRDDLLARLSRLHADGVPVVILSGMGGAGKTALAVHWAHGAAGRFPDGQLYVNLRGHSPQPPLAPLDALASMLRALGLPADQVPLALDEAAAAYRSLLADSRVLIVLDNAASAEQIRPLLPGSPTCLVVVTSRYRLTGLIATDAAHRLDVGALRPREAEALLHHTLRWPRSHTFGAAIGHLAAQCAYLPLALRIAAANLAEQPGRSVDEYLRELQDGRLAALTIEDDPGTAVRAAFDLSYRRLAPTTRRFFRQLGLVPGPDLTIPAAAVIAGTPEEPAERMIRHLAAAHLVEELKPGRFALHDLLRDYAAEQAQAEDNDDNRNTALRRLFGWYGVTARTAIEALVPGSNYFGPDTVLDHDPPRVEFNLSASALVWLDTESNNLIAAVQYAARNDLPETARHLGESMRIYFWLTRDATRWLTTAHAALDAAIASGDWLGQALAHLGIGQAYRSRNEYPRATENLDTALRLFQQIQQLDAEAYTHDQLGGAYAEQGKMTEAESHFTRALAIEEQLGRSAQMATCLNRLSGVCMYRGQLDRALAHLTRALAMAEQAGSGHHIALQMEGLGVVYRMLGRLDEAIANLNKALAIRTDLGDRASVTSNLAGLGEVYRDAGRYPDAIDCAQAALDRAREDGDHRTEANALNTLGSTERLRRRADVASRLHRHALTAARQAGDAYAEAESHLGLAEAAIALGHPDQAIAEANRALTMAARNGFRAFEAQALLATATAAHAQGRDQDATEAGQHALEIYRETGHKFGETTAQQLLASIAHE
jgi:DNA-binding SARP family transcriptional activator